MTIALTWTCREAGSSKVELMTSAWSPRHVQVHYLRAVAQRRNGVAVKQVPDIHAARRLHEAGGTRALLV